ncbi:MAG: hypothetical protein RLO81_01085 [Fulvivirga sp.]|uniref:hypothetical protein n=1 Tax=Fulvivirga sp. TaxID=1931237 RepID=UPI0032EDA950
MKKLVAFLFFVGLYQMSFGHPAGSLIEFNNKIVWSYVNPVGDLDHHACIMVWDKKTEPRVYITSKFAGSDYLLYANDDEMYVIERRHNHSTDKAEFRVLKTDLIGEPQELWPWQENNHRIGDAGFYMQDDNEIIFSKYPSVYRMKKGVSPDRIGVPIENVGRIRKVNDGLLILSDNDCYLMDEGNHMVLRQWNNIDKEVENAPLNRNMIYDFDLSERGLIVAYWGGREFLLMTENKKETIKKMKGNFVPHWVLASENECFLFSSLLDFDQPIIDNKSTIQPLLLRYNFKEFNTIWNADIK